MGFTECVDSILSRTDLNQTLICEPRNWGDLLCHFRLLDAK